MSLLDSFDPTSLLHNQLETACFHEVVVVEEHSEILNINRLSSKVDSVSLGKKDFLCASLMVLDKGWVG